MFDINKFLLPFGLINGTDFDGYVLSNVAYTHEIIKQHQEYRYSIMLLFTNIGTGTSDKLLSTVINNISQQHIVHDIRSSYRCVIDYPDDITYNIVGHAYRINKC